MLIAMSLILLAVLLFASLILAESAFTDEPRNLKTRLFDSMRRIAWGQRHLQKSAQRGLLFFSLCCCLLSIGIIPQLAILLSPFHSRLPAGAFMVSGSFASLIILGLVTLLQIAGEISLALTERRQNSSAALLLNSYFWLPLLLAWAAVAAYLPIDSPQAAKGAVTSMWLFALQPLGCLAFVLALLGPYLLINACPTHRVSPVQNWIRELRMLTGVLLIVSLIGGRSCFASSETENTPLDIGGAVIQVVLIPVLIWMTLRLKTFLRRRSADPTELWKMILWLALISVTASFLAFHILGMSDHLMHVLLNFSLLAIWAGFIVPKYSIGSMATVPD
ncbi:hypothetical protein [Gimesia fumaroli]|uniref:Uncharacterized protein n=1 Tax=Gimesia fumaroli TaxID=2527976 RepID=A0A518I6W7_9PLAN|nr:hypothetical protein [Gimesia fumaroli]QDV48824.1 hypothetical protein Enr17x_08380 [Gimesia fumaroli]